MEISLEPILETDQEMFLKMAVRYFKELNKDFTPHKDWEKCYFESVLTKETVELCWIVFDNNRIGFVIYGNEKHRFLPRLIGYIYEFYIVPEYRRKGLGTVCARNIIQRLRSKGIHKIDIEVANGNEKAIHFWKSLGFLKVAERFTLREG